MHRQARTGEFRDEVKANTGILVLRAGSSGAQRLGPEDNPIIFEGGGEYLGENGRDGVGRVLAEAKEIEITGRAIGYICPETEQHRALQDKPVPMR